ncbi:hypothetical protein [Nocardia sp. CA-120079]|uniref:hypothetical protein n=1 Tax=Nocardia sp. CA-120079 TaxID=3239974 RepID=UPI003D995D4A
MLQNPYSSAIGMLSGVPTTAALPSSMLALASEDPSRCRFDGIHCWKPYWVVPMLIASHHRCGQPEIGAVEQSRRPAGRPILHHRFGFRFHEFGAVAEHDSSGLLGAALLEYEAR